MWETVDGTTLEQLSSLNLEDAERKYGAPLMAVHRVDLHKELLRLALHNGEGISKGVTPAALRLGTLVVIVDTTEGIIELEDGSKREADLILAADGLHSVVKSAALKHEAKPTPSGLSAFRFLIPTDTLRDDPSLSRLLKWKVPGLTILADTANTVKERHVVWYPCQG
jgi:salicylate hydroxylase